MKRGAIFLPDSEVCSPTVESYALRILLCATDTLHSIALELCGLCRTCDLSICPITERSANTGSMITMMAP